MNPFGNILARKGRKAVILDGGFGTELERVGKDYHQDPLWSARILVDDPQAVQTVHERYYEAGADVGTTCSYQATFNGFERAGVARDEAEQLFKRSVQLADAARDKFWTRHQAQAAEGPRDDCEEGSGAAGSRRVRPLVAFSSGPYGAGLADGSEYSGSYERSTSVEQMVDFHRRKLQAVDGENYDVIAFETLPSLKEARAIAQLLRTEPPGKPAWLSFNCCDEQHVASGESFAEEAVALAAQAPSIVAIGVNCVPPRNVPALLHALSKAAARLATPPLLAAYPNSGEGWRSAEGEWDGDSELRGRDLGEVGLSWVRAGARLVGGCCRTTPEHIAALAAALT